MKKKLRIGLLLLMVVSLVGTPGALAFPAYKDAFTTKYSNTNTKLDTCSTCHVSPSGGAPWNFYGFDVLIQVATGATIDEALTNTEQMDSDRDTFSNIVEINARTFPGNESDHPDQASAVTTLNLFVSLTAITAGIPTNVTFTVTDSGAKVSGAIVTLSGSATGSRKTDVNGSAVMSVNATSAGKITATASMSGFASGSAIIIVQDIGQPTGTIPDPEVEVYDDNHDGRINKTEAVKAVMDFFAGSAPKNQAIKVVVAYFSGDTTASS